MPCSTLSASVCVIRVKVFGARYKPVPSQFIMILNDCNRLALGVKRS